MRSRAMSATPRTSPTTRPRPAGARSPPRAGSPPPLSTSPPAAGGRTSPSAPGFHTAEIFFTDDSGTYILETRDAPATVARGEDGVGDLRLLLAATEARIRQLS